MVPANKRKDREALKNKIQYEANHKILGCTQRLLSLLELGYPEDIFREYVQILHEEIITYVTDVNIYFTSKEKNNEQREREIENHTD